MTIYIVSIIFKALRFFVRESTEETASLPIFTHLFHAGLVIQTIDIISEYQFRFEKTSIPATVIDV